MGWVLMEVTASPTISAVVRSLPSRLSTTASPGDATWYPSRASSGWASSQSVSSSSPAFSAAGSSSAWCS